MVIPLVLQFSCRLPVSVCGTGTSISTLAAFLASVNSSASLLVFTPHHRLASDMRTSLHASLTIWPRLSISVVRLSFCVPASNYCGGTGISTCCPSSTPFGLNLGPDLPWVVEPSPGNLRLSTEMIKHFSRYLCRHSLLYALHSPFRYCFCAHTLLLYQLS